MNVVDLAIIAILILFGFRGFNRNFIGELADLTSFLLALVLSLSFYNNISNLFQRNFSLPHSISTVVGFITIWFFVETVLMILTQIIFSKFKFSWVSSKLNLLSIILSFCKGVILIAIILIIIASFRIQPQIKKTVDNSLLGSFIILKTQSLETPLKNIFGGITEDTLTFLTIKPETTEKIDLGFKNNNFFANESLENQMIFLVNKERVTRNLKVLELDPKLRDVARMHSKDMFLRGYFAHYTPEGKNVADRAEDAGVRYLIIGENLAYAPSLMLAQSGLMDSPGHRANILSLDFSKIGVGIMDGKEYGLMITQVFSN